MQRRQAKFGMILAMLILLLPILAAVLFSLSFSFYWLGWLVIAGLVALVAFVQFADAAGWSRRHIGLGLWFGGLLFCAYNQFWIAQMNPLLWSPDQFGSVHVMQIYGWIFCALFCSVGFGIFALLGTKPLLKLIRSRRLDWWAVGQITAIWIASEWLRSIAFSVLSWGRGTVVGPYWDFGAFGFALSTSPLGYLTRILGLYGISGLGLALSLLIYFALRGQWRPLAWTSLGVALLASLCAVAFPASSKSVRIGLVQTPNYTTTYQNNLLSIINNSTKSTDLPVDALILPESIKLESATNPDIARQILDSSLGNAGGIWVESGQIQPADPTLLWTMIHDTSGRVVEQSAKSVLAPVGEYLPYIIQFGFEVTGNHSLETAYTLGHSFRHGPNENQPFAWRGTRYGILACTGILSSAQYQHLTRAGSEVLINSSNLAIFNFNQRSYTQIRQMAHFQAIANARPFVHAANGGYSYALTSDGQFVASAGTQQLAFVSVQLRTNHHLTPFSALGEWTVLAAALYLAATNSVAQRLIRKFR